MILEGHFLRWWLIIYKSCSKCGKIHDINYKCNANYKYEIRNDVEIRKLRNKNSWKKKAVQIKEDSKYLCELCLEEGIYNYKDLEIHHITKIRDNRDRLLDNYNLICLCKHHHKLADEGNINQDYLFELAKKREERNL